MDVKTDEGLKALIEQGKAKGYLTYDQVNDYLPDEAVNPEKLDSLLVALDELGIELVNEAPQALEGAAGLLSEAALAAKELEAVGELSPLPAKELPKLS